MKEITSSENKIFKHVSKLKIKKHRDAFSEYIIEGTNVIKEAIAYKANISFIIVNKNILDNNANQEVKELLKSLKAFNFDIYTLDEKLFIKLADTETPQGLLAVVKKENWIKKIVINNGNIIVLDRLQDPGNIGTILRTADSAGFEGAIVLKGTADIYSPKVVRSATGSLFRLPILFGENPEEILELLNRYKKTIICADLNGKEYYFNVPMKNQVAIIVGNEGNGICEEFLHNCHKKVKIPMKGSTESLNAAVAAAILIYESVRD